MQEKHLCTKQTTLGGLGRQVHVFFDMQNITTKLGSSSCVLQRGRRRKRTAQPKGTRSASVSMGHKGRGRTYDFGVGGAGPELLCDDNELIPVHPDDVAAAVFGCNAIRNQAVHLQQAPHPATQDHKSMQGAWVRPSVGFTTAHDSGGFCVW